MKKLLLGTIVLALISIFPITTMAGVDVSVGISIPLPPPVTFEAPPDVVVLPDTNGVYVAPGVNVSFRSAILPPYLRKTRSMEQLIPWLYLKGVSTGDFSDALAALVGKDAPGLSAPTISRLKTVWQQEFQQWQKRNLSEKRYVYFWADGIYCNVRMDDKQCLLVIMGATADGVKELVAIEGGFRESEMSWKQLLLDLKSRGLTTAPQLAIGDGALGFWKALSKVYDGTRWQRLDIFFWNGFWWRPWEGRWYRSPYYDRGWAYFDSVPRFYYDVDPYWRGHYLNHNWHGHIWNYQPIHHSQLQQNWKNWQGNRSWGNQKTWGVQGYTPKPQQQRQVIRQQRQTLYEQKPEVQKHQQFQRQQRQQQYNGESHQQSRGHEGRGEEHGR